MIVALIDRQTHENTLEVNLFQCALIFKVKRCGHGKLLRLSLSQETPNKRKTIIKLKYVGNLEFDEKSVN